MLACADGEVAASRTIKAAKYSKWGIYGDRSSGLRVPVCLCDRRVEQTGPFLCQMVGGVETKVCVPTGDVTPSINKGCGPFWLTRLSVWTAGFISASMLAHNRRMTPTHLREKKCR